MGHLIFVLLLAGAAFAQSGFTGTWKTNLQKTKVPDNPESRTYDNGIYRCSDCNIKEVKADGHDQKVDSPYLDTLSVKAINDRTIEKVGKRNDEVVFRATETVSPDGRTLTSSFRSTTDRGREVRGSIVMTRVGPAPQGKHAINGEWKPQKFEANEAATMVTFKQKGDSFSMTSLSGSSFNAKLDGKDYPYKGDPGISTVVLRRIDDQTIEETDKLKGKPVYRARYQLAADGKTMNVDFEDLRDPIARNPKINFVMDRQPPQTTADK